MSTKWCKRILEVSVITGFVMIIFLVKPASAHRPYFEEEDLKPDQPWYVSDATISTAFYGTLAGGDDVDYFAFDGKQGQSILLAITIPQIEGQEDFAPAMLISGPGMESGSVPESVDLKLNAGHGLEVILPSDEAPEPFYEPFSGTSYWQRQEQRVNLPEDGRYLVAVWHAEGEVGRYVFVIGDKERPGGDPLFPVKMKTYWTPVSGETFGPETEVERLNSWWAWIARFLGIVD